MTTNYLPTNTNLYMTFSVQGKEYAILAEKIIEIIQLPQLEKVEKLPEYVVGLMNLRGKIISVYDVRKLLGLKLANYTVDTQVLIIKNEESYIGIIVDSVDNAHLFDTELLEPLPYSSNNELIEGIYNEDDKFIAFLNLENLLGSITHPVDSSYQSEYADLFPVEPEQIEKLQKRAFNLQKELKTSIDSTNYYDDEFVTFSLNNEVFCLNLKYVKEFGKLKALNLTKVPCVPDYIIGMINLRGEFLTVLDIKNFLSIPQSPITDKTKIIVIKSDFIQIGIIVDEVFDMINIPVEKLNYKNSFAKYDNNKLILGELLHEHNKVLSIINAEKLFEDERLNYEDNV